MEKNQKEVQDQYAKDLGSLSTFGLAYIIITFFIYLSGIMPNTVAAKDIPKYWKMKAEQYSLETGFHQGLSWIEHMGKGDVISFSALAFLSLVSIITYVSILPLYIRQNDTKYTVITILQILTLLLAASGIVSGGGH